MSEKKRILFFIYEMGAGGAARTLLNIINHLDRNQFEPYLVTLNFEGSYESELRDDVVFQKLETKRLSRSVFKLRDVIREEKIDVVFSTIPRVNTIAIIAAKLAGKRVKSVVREADNLGGTWKENVQLKLFGLVYRVSNQVISLSEGVKRNLVRRYHLNPSSIKVIYNPVDRHAIEELASEELQSDMQKLFANKPVLLTAGRLVKQKDHHTMLRAFAKLPDHLRQKLIILGEGSLKIELQQLANELQIQDQVSFVGFQSNPYKYIARADVFVLSSIHEGFSHVLAESLAVGTPVVSTDCQSGPSEVLVNGRFGILTPVGDATAMSEQLQQLLQADNETLSEIRKDGKKRVQDFDASKIASAYGDVFTEVCER